jgi:leucine-rich repeat protein SHOC2
MNEKTTNESTAPHADKKTRVEFLRDQFEQDYKKAIKKQKFLHMQSPEFKTFTSKIDPNMLQNFIQAAKDRVKKGAPQTQKEEWEMYVDPAFFAFKVMMGVDEKESALTPPQLLFHFFYENDPTSNKEYLHWYINLYRDVIKNRKPFTQVSEKFLDRSMMQDGSYREMLFGGDENRFFEDLFKVNEALEKFDFLKKTKTIKESQKDINRYSNYNDLLKLVKPFIAAEVGSSDVDTLDHQELKAIENQVQYEAGDRRLDEEPRAKLMYQDDNWVIVWTVNKAANVAFGKYTTWCTAGTRYGSMFDSYDKQGKLFVLIRKGKGSKEAISIDPKMRLQFHFESNQYMDANDKSIRVAEWLDHHQEIKEFFKHHIVKEVLPKKSNKYTEHIKFLMELGYGDELIKIYKEVKPAAIDISSFNIKPEVLEEIGEITSLEKLTLSDVGLTKLPESLKKLTKLKYLCCSSNRNLTEIPSWLNQMTQLKDIHFMDCDIQNEVDLTGLTNLEQVAFDFNENLTKCPKGLGGAKKLKRLSLSNCNISEIPSDVLNCEQMFMLDLHFNLNLKKVPLNLTKMPNLHAICIDDTSISKEDVDQMIRHSIGVADIVRYGTN